MELCFPDRWSLAVFSQRAFSALTPEERGALAHRFYNDTYQMCIRDRGLAVGLILFFMLFEGKKKASEQVAVGAADDKANQ